MSSDTTFVEAHAKRHVQGVAATSSPIVVGKRPRRARCPAALDELAHAQLHSARAVYYDASQLLSTSECPHVSLARIGEPTRLAAVGLQSKQRTALAALHDELVELAEATAPKPRASGQRASD